MPAPAQDPRSVALWEQAQANSLANSDRTTDRYDDAVAATGGVWQVGEGSIGPGTFQSNGQPPN